MAETRISEAVRSDMDSAVSDYSVDEERTDAAEEEETFYDNTKWPENFGYYKAIPELASAIDAKATWTVGKGYNADEITSMLLDSIKGWGADTFNTILENAIRTYHIGGDAFIEIIRDEEGNLINLKPLDPGSVRIVSNKKGIIIRYEMREKNQRKKFAPEDIFHLARNRVADEIHGVSMIDNLKNIILMRNEAMEDLKEVFHRFVKPKFIFHLDTDDTDEIADFKTKMDNATGEGENMYIPKDAVVPENLAISQHQTLNPLPWIDALNQYFFQAAGVPDIIIGGGRALTEAAAKISYLAFQQTIEEEQLYIEEQVLSQLNLYIELEFPASLENELLSDKAKDGSVNIQPNETRT